MRAENDWHELASERFPCQFTDEGVPYCEAIGEGEESQCAMSRPFLSPKTMPNEHFSCRSEGPSSLSWQTTFFHISPTTVYSTLIALWNLVERLAKPLANRDHELTDKEWVVLYSACYLHDIGMQY